MTTRATQVTHLRSSLAPKGQVSAIIGHRFRGFQRVRMANRCMYLLTRHSSLSTATTATFAYVLREFSLTRRLLSVRVQVRGEQVTVSLTSRLTTNARRAFQYADASVSDATKLRSVRFFSHFRRSMKSLTRPITTVNFCATSVRIHGVVVHATFLDHSTSFKEDHIIIRFSRRAKRRFFYLITYRHAINGPLFMRQDRVLIRVTKVRHIPAIRFNSHSWISRPVRLSHLPVISKDVYQGLTTGFNGATRLNHPFQVFFHRQRFVNRVHVSFNGRSNNITQSKRNDRLLLLINHFKVIRRVRPIRFFPSAFFRVRWSMLVRLSIRDNVSQDTLFRGFNGRPRLVNLLPLLERVTRSAFSLNASFPMESRFTFVHISIFLTSHVALRFAYIRSVRILRAVTNRFQGDQRAFQF